MRPGTAVSQATGATDPSAPTKRLADILLASITALAGAGEVEAACRLAGQACAALRGADPATARRFDALLHRLAARLLW